MVISCPECSTKFRVNPERIPDAGAKVRCARCKHIFLAEKPAPAEEAPAIEDMPLEEDELTTDITESEPEPTSEIPAPVPAYTEQMSATEVSDVPGEDTVKSLAADSAEESFSYEQFRELDSTETDEENFTFGSEEESAEQLDIPSETAAVDSEEEETFSFSAPEEEAEVTETETTQGEEKKFVETSEPVPASADEAIANVFAETEEAEAEPVITSLPAEEKSAAGSSFMRILLLLILGLLIIGGALYYINGPEQIEQFIQQIMGQQQNKSTESGRIALTNLEGKFINNQEAGELFVIRGEATNNYPEPRAAIQVKGVIFDQNGKPLLQKTIFCGNPINDQELQTLQFNKLEEMMGNQFGKALDNMKVNSKEAIPFTIAFRNLPRELSEFSVDVTSSKAVTE